MKDLDIILFSIAAVIILFLLKFILVAPWLLLIPVAAAAIIVSIVAITKAAAQKKYNKHLYDLINNYVPTTPLELLNRHVPVGQYPGIYIIQNHTKNKFYVGQSVNVFSRAPQHFKGHGSPDVYYDYARGDQFTIRFIMLANSGAPSLNTLERDYIAYFHSADPRYGYNKNHGNAG